MTAWTCPRCDRTFGRTNRPHVCAAGMPIEVWLAERTDPQRRAAEAVLAIARRYRGLVVEAVGVGVLIKRTRTIVELRPKTRWARSVVPVQRDHHEPSHRAYARGVGRPRHPLLLLWHI